MLETKRQMETEKSRERQKNSTGYKAEVCGNRNTADTLSLDELWLVDYSLLLRLTLMTVLVFGSALRFNFNA